MFISKKKWKGFFVTLCIMMLLPCTASFAATYTVTSGDSLYTIGQLFNTTSSAMMKENQLSGTIIYPGQKLRVPATEYTVKSGDTLYLIAKRNGITLEALRKANNKWDHAIYPGQTLIYPVTKQTVAKKSTIPYTSADLDLLSRLITAEADGEPYDAKVGVGGVVINRVKDSRFPNTIQGVIYEKAYGFFQFTPVENGWIDKPASDSAKQAAYDALSGKDPSNGAVYYFDDSATNKWLWSKPLAAWIGRMVYVY